MISTRHWRAAALTVVLAMTPMAWISATATPVAAGLGTVTQEQLCITGIGPVGQVNDVVFDAAGNLWWTEGGTVSPGAIGRRSPDGRVDRFAEGLVYGKDALRSIALGPDGNVWFTSFGLGLTGIGRITPDGVITMFRGLGDGKIAWAITAGADGNLWFTEPGGASPTIGRITPAGVITELPIPAAMGNGLGITLGPDGNVWFTGKESIGRITPAGAVTVFTEGLEDDVDGIPTTHNGFPVALTFGSDGNVWFLRLGSTTERSLGRMTPGGVVTDMALPAAGSILGDDPTGFFFEMTLGPDGNVWFTDFVGGRIGRVTPAGDLTIFTDGVRNTKLGLDVTKGPVGITPGPDGALWYGEAVNFEGQDPGGIARINLEGEVESFGSISVTDPILALTSAADGTIWFTNRFGIGRRTVDGRLEMVNSDGFILLPELNSTLPGGITTDGAGNVWFTELDANRVGRLTPRGVLTRFSAGITPGSEPRDIVLGSDGNLWFTEDVAVGGIGRLGRVTPAGVVAEFPTGTDPANSIDALTAGPDGNLWFTESGPAASIGRMTPSGVVTRFAVPDAPPHPAFPPDEPFIMTGITTGPDGNVWFTHTHGALGRVTPAGSITLFPTAIHPAFGFPTLPTELATVDGALWYTSSFLGTVGRMTVDGVTTNFKPHPPNVGEFDFPPYPGFSNVTPNLIVAGPADTVWWSAAQGFGPAKLVYANERDAIGAPCTPDEDADGVADGKDAFPFDPTEWLDTDLDGIGNNADADDDADGLADVDDPAPLDPDADDDGRLDGADNCITVANPDQADGDRDGVGDRCDRSVTITVSHSGAQVQSRLLDATGAPIRGATIVFNNRSGARLCTAVTDANGVAKCMALAALLGPILGLVNPGAAGVQASFGGDAAHDPGVARTWLTAPTPPPPPPAVPPIKIVIRL